MGGRRGGGPNRDTLAGIVKAEHKRRVKLRQQTAAAMDDLAIQLSVMEVQPPLSSFALLSRSLTCIGYLALAELNCTSFELTISALQGMIPTPPPLLLPCLRIVLLLLPPLGCRSM